MTGEWIPSEKWEVIVRHVPIASVDLVVRSPDGIVLGKRANAPAKGKWFVPGGRIHKHESLTDAVHRLANAELGVNDATIRESLGTYEHFYDASDINDSEGKHYLANGFVVETATGVKDMTIDDQHSEIRAFHTSDLPSNLHEYTATYLRDSDSVVSQPDEHL